MKKISLIVKGLFLFGCNGTEDTKDKVGEAYADIWYLTASNPSAGVLVLEVNATAHSTCQKYMELKKMIVWDRYNAALKVAADDTEGRKSAVKMMVDQICKT